MGVLDFDAVFDMLDPSRRGYLGVDQIHLFDGTLHFTPISVDQVTASVQQICGKNAQGNVKKEDFVKVMHDLGRRRTLEERLQWDFRALDKTGDYRLPLSDVLTLFRLTQGDKFSMAAWNRFINSRGQPNADVCFDEVRVFLCNAPNDDPCSTNEITAEEDRLNQLAAEQHQEDFNKANKYQKDDRYNRRKKQEYQEQTKRLARRKHNIWEKDGIEGVVYDDGIDRGEEVPSRISTNKNMVGINDLIDALTKKYDILRKKLFWDMLRKQHGTLEWGSMSNSDRYEVFEQLSSDEKQMRFEYSLVQFANSLYGAGVTHEVSLEGLMGSLRADYQNINDQINKQRLQLKEEGRSEKEINDILAADFSHLGSGGRCGSDQMLINMNNRFEAEKTTLLESIQSTSGRKMSPSEVLMEFCLLVRQQYVAEYEESFRLASVAMGLAERIQNFRREWYDPDRMRQEDLSHGRLQARKSPDFKPVFDDSASGAKAKTNGLVEAQAGLVKELSLKHALEREMLVLLLTGKSSYEAKTQARRLNANKRKSELASLRNAFSSWLDGSEEYQAAHRKTHQNILLKAVSVYYQNRADEIKAAKGYVVEDSIHSSILADLQQKQDQEFYILIRGLPKKTEKEILGIKKEHCHARKGEHFGNLAKVVMGTFEYSEEEKPYILALEEKYDGLRSLLFRTLLEREHGKAWHMLKPKEISKLVAKKMDQELKLRQAGQLEEMASLIPPDLLDNSFNCNTLYQLMGEDRAAYAHRMALEDEDNDELKDEPPAEQVQSVNLLADLFNRFYAEQDAIVSCLRSPEEQQKSEAERTVLLAMLKLEKKLAYQTLAFSVGARMIGLSERIFGALEKRHPADMVRAEQFAAVLVSMRSRGQHGPRLKKIYETRPDRGDLVGWQYALLLEMTQKHWDEIDLMFHIMLDPGLEDLIEAARTMDNYEQQKRLMELYKKHKKLNFESEDDRDENTTIIEEAAALRFVLKQNVLKAQGSQGESSDVICSLFTELFSIQQKEKATLLKRIGILDEEELKINRESEVEARRQDINANVIAILTKYEGTAEDDEILKALDEKYDALRLKMLTEALMKELGEAEWQRLSEKERQQKILERKREERRLRREGKFDELSRLLGEDKENQEQLARMLGDSKAEFEKKLKEKLARRKRRLEQGLDPDEGGEDIEEGEEQASNNPLVNLQLRYEQEKDALMARLKGMDDELLGERERQAELVRLKREKRRAENEDNFEAAAMLVGLAERQQATNNERLKNDRQRQEQLAKQRLEELRKKRNQKREMDQSVVTEGGIVVLQDAVMKKLEASHEEERMYFTELLSIRVPDKLKNLAKNSQEFDREEKRTELREQRDKMAIEQSKLNHEILLEGCVYKVESRREKLSKANPSQLVNDEEVHVSLMADLQEAQDREAELYLKGFPDKVEDELIKLQTQIIYEQSHHRADNIAAVVLGNIEVREAGDSELVDALKGKYDALKDKLMMESLMNQYGEAEWQKMSEQERQRKLVELRRKEKKLRQEGRLDEAAALLGDAVKNHELLENLLGQTKEEQRQKVQEKIQKRRERMSQGLSEEECDELEKEDQKEEKSKRNVLQDLEGAFEKEKEELLRRLKIHQDMFASEKERQLELARLKRDQRRAQQEEKFESAALLIGMSKEHAKTIEESRSQQEKLARERLQSRLAARKDAAKRREEEAEVPMPMNDDIPALVEALTTELEKKHLSEREFLIQLLKDPETAAYRDEILGLGPEALAPRLKNLRSQRQAWRDSGADDPDQQTTILQEATAVRLGMIQLDSSESPSDEDSQVVLLADLQQKQDLESANTVNNINSKDAEEIRNLKQAHCHSRMQAWYDNVAFVLLADSEESEGSSDPQLISALEHVYDAARVKLFTDALIRQFGQEIWDSMPVRERQANLIKLSIQEKQFRQEGNFGEALKLLALDQDESAELCEKLGVSSAAVATNLKEKEEFKEKIVEERKAKGLSIDEEVVEVLAEAEMELIEKERGEQRNIVEELHNHFAGVRDALVMGLDNNDPRYASDKLRKLEMAQMKKIQKEVESEENFDCSAILLNIFELNQIGGDASIIEEMGLSGALAKERLAVCLKRQPHKHPESLADRILHQLEEEAANDKAEETIQSANGSDKDRNPAAEALEMLEKKQSIGRDILLSMISAVQSDTEVIQYADSVNHQEAKLEVERMRQEREKLRRESLAKLSDGADLAQIASQRAQHYKQMTNAVALKIKLEKAMHKEEHPELSDEEAFLEAAVSLMTNLQGKHQAESNAVVKLIADNDEKTIGDVVTAEKMVIKQGWLDSIANVVYCLTTAGGEDEISMETDQTNIEDELKNEKQAEIQKLEERVKLGENVDVQAEMAKLEAEQEAKRRSMQAAMEKQKAMLQSKLAAKRMAKENREYEQDAAIMLLKMAERHQQEALDKAQSEKSRQGDMMQQRLAARREARQQAAEEERLRQEAEKSSSKSGSSTPLSRPSTMDSQELGGMRRERTLVEVDLSEDQKNEVYMQLVQDQANLNRKLDDEHRRHEDQLKRRLEEMKGKRMNETTALLSMAERQKSTLESLHKEEHERQVEMTKERVARLRYEKTMTMKQRGDKNAKKFDEIINDDAKMTEDEKMNMAAKKMEDKFKIEEKEVQSRTKQTFEADNDSESFGATAPSAGQSRSDSQKMSSDEKMKQLKQRREMKKRQRKGEED